MSKAEFSWIKDLISTDEKALGVYLAVLDLRFIYSTKDFESTSHFEQLINQYNIPIFQLELEAELLERKLHGEVEVFITTETFNAFVTFFKKITKYVKTDLVLNAKSRNVLLERIEAEFFETFAKAYKKLWLRLDRIPSEYRKTTALLLRKIRSREIEVFDETISGSVRIFPSGEEGVLLDVLKSLNLPMNKIDEFKLYMVKSYIMRPPIIPAPCFMDDVLRFLGEGVVEEGGIDLKKIIRLRIQSLKGLVSGYGCSDFRFRPVFPSSVLPSGFEGTWECCLLGQGGWGSTYLCRKGNVKAVFKTPRGFEPIIEGRGEPPTVHTKTLEKVRNEANTISKLEHPNIIKLLSYSEKTPLLIYEYADYGTLHWQLSKGWKPSQKDILLIGIQLGDALRYIHSRGLIHGDIKPGNVFIKDRVIKLGDFSSITKLLSTMSYSRIPSTIGFRAPEQVYRDIRERAKELGVENRIDVYQLANTLLYMLTGESIDGEDVNDKLVAEKLEGIPHNELKRLIGTGLAVEPEKRPSAEELIKQLYVIYEKISGKSG